MPSMGRTIQEGPQRFALWPQVVLVRLKPDLTRARLEIELHVEPRVARRQDRCRRQPGTSRRSSRC